jgi:hypothetical protein
MKKYILLIAFGVYDINAYAGWLSDLFKKSATKESGACDLELKDKVERGEIVDGKLGWSRVTYSPEEGWQSAKNICYPIYNKFEAELNRVYTGYTIKTPFRYYAEPTDYGSVVYCSMYGSLSYYKVITYKTIGEIQEARIWQIESCLRKIVLNSDENALEHNRLSNFRKSYLEAFENECVAEKISDKSIKNEVEMEKVIASAKKECNVNLASTNDSSRSQIKITPKADDAESKSKPSSSIEK